MGFMVAGRHGGHWKDLATLSQHGSGVSDRIAANFDMVSQHGPKLAQLCIDGVSGNSYPDGPRFNFQIGKFRTRAQVSRTTQDAVSYVREMPGLGIVEHDTRLDLRRVPHNTTVADDTIAADIGTLANLRARADDSWSLNESTRFHNGA